MSVREDLRKESNLLFYKIAKTLRRDISFDLIKLNGITDAEFLIDFNRTCVLEDLRNIMKSIKMANAIYPVCQIELDKRRLLQDEAIGYSETLIEDLNYIVDLFPDNLKCLINYSDEIDHLIKVLRRWKKSNNKYLKNTGLQSVPAYFCNCNNNGNANNNSASNADNGVRFDLTRQQSDCKPEEKSLVKGDC